MWPANAESGDRIAHRPHRLKSTHHEQEPLNCDDKSKLFRSSTSTSPRILVILVTMSETLSLAEVKAHLSELVGRVDRQHDRVTVTVHGRPSAVLLSPDDLDALEETIAILSDDAAVRQLTASDAELARGEGESEQDLAKAMRRRRAKA